MWKNKNILITGGTSGLGKALAIKLSESGANVVVVARDKIKLEKLEIEHSDIKAIQGDISEKNKIHSIVFSAQSILGNIDYLFNVASYLGETPLKLLIDTECENFEKVLQTNLLAPFRISKLVASNMLLNKGGVIINISSDAAINAYPTWGSYSVSKAAVDHLSRIFDEELKTHGIRFLSIDPGDMNTPMHFDAIPDANPENLKSPELSADQICELLEKQDFSIVRRKL